MKTQYVRGLALPVLALVIFGVLAGCSSDKDARSDPTVAPADTPAAATSVPPSPAPAASRLTRPLTEQDVVWDYVVQQLAGTIKPVLKPSTLPPGIQTASADQSGKPMIGVFQVEYDGPAMTLWVQAGPLNPPPPPGQGEQTQVAVRGQTASLNIEDKANSSQSVWLWWQEPATYIVDGHTTQNGLYELRAKGIDPATLISIAESLVPYP